MELFEGLKKICLLQKNHSLMQNLENANFDQNQLRVLNTLILDTEEASFEDFIKNGTITFHTNAIPQTSEMTPEAEVQPAVEAVAKRGFGSFFKKVWNSVKHFGEEIEKAVAKFIEEVKDFVDGDVDIDQGFPLKTMGWNTEKKPVTIDNFVVCSSCYMTLGVGMKFHLTLEDFKVQFLQVMATLSMDAQAELNLGTKWTNQAEVVLAVIASNPITFTIGPVPFVLQFKLPISVGYVVEADIKTGINVGASAHSSTSFGIQYSNGVLTRMLTGDTKFEGHHQGWVGLTGHAKVAGYIFAPFTVVFDFLGNVYAGLKPFVEASGGNDDKNCGGVSLAINGGFQIGVGAGVGLKIAGKQIFEKKLPAKTVYNMQMPIMSDCFGDSGDNSVPVNTAGSTWAGQQTKANSPGCEAFPEADISYQLVSNDTDGVYFYGVMNSYMEESGGCILQTMFKAEIHDNDIHLIPTGEEDDTFCSCENPDIQMEPVEARGTISSDWNSISITTDDKCISVELHRAT